MLSIHERVGLEIGKGWKYIGHGIDEGSEGTKGGTGGRVCGCQEDESGCLEGRDL